MICGFALSLVGWIFMNDITGHTVIYAMIFFTTGIVAMIAGVLMLIEVKNGKIYPMFIDKK